MKAEKQPQIQPMPFDFLAGIPDSSQLRTNAFYLSFVLHPLAFCRGAVAQLGERLNGIQEVVGSTPIGSTTLRSGFPPELRVASHFFHHGMLEWNTFPERRVFPEALTKGGQS